MTHEEAIAIKIYYEAMHHSYENDIDLRYNSHDNDTITYYKDSVLTMREYNYVMKSMFFDEPVREKNEELKRMYINIIADYLTKLDDVYTKKVRLR